MTTNNSNISPEAVTARERNRATDGTFGFKHQSDPEVALPAAMSATEQSRLHYNKLARMQYQFRKEMLAKGLEAMDGTIREMHPTAHKIRVIMPTEFEATLRLDAVFDGDGNEIADDESDTENAVSHYLADFDDYDEVRKGGFGFTAADGPDTDDYFEYVLSDGTRGGVPPWEAQNTILDAEELIAYALQRQYDAAVAGCRYSIRERFPDAAVVRLTESGNQYVPGYIPAEILDANGGTLWDGTTVFGNDDASDDDSDLFNGLYGFTEHMSEGQVMAHPVDGVDGLAVRLRD